MTKLRDFFPSDFYTIRIFHMGTLYSLFFTVSQSRGEVEELEKQIEDQEGFKEKS